LKRKQTTVSVLKLRKINIKNQFLVKIQENLH
jgi:hypothetical protein